MANTSGIYSPGAGNSLTSPGVLVREFDFSQIIPDIALGIGGIVGRFAKGPINSPVLIESENDLVKYFGAPTDYNYTEWHTAAEFLKYHNKMYVVRAEPSGVKNASVSGLPVLVRNSAEYKTLSEVTLNKSGDFISKNPGNNSNDVIIMAVDYDSWDNFVAWCNDNLQLFPSNKPLYDYFNTSPDTTSWVSGKVSDSDVNKKGEVHVLLLDGDGSMTGVPYTVIEKFEGLSKAVDAKDFNGTPLYYPQHLNSFSNYVYFGSLPDSTSGTVDLESASNPERTSRWGFMSIGSTSSDVSGDIAVDNIQTTITFAGTGYESTPTVSFGTIWAENSPVAVGDQRYFGDNLYNAVMVGETGSTGVSAPIHSTGEESDGGVIWAYAGKVAIGRALIEEISPTEGYRVSSILITYHGSGYKYETVTAAGFVTFAGGSPTAPATATAVLATISNSKQFVAFNTDKVLRNVALASRGQGYLATRTSVFIGSKWKPNTSVYLEKDQPLPQVWYGDYLFTLHILSNHVINGVWNGASTTVFTGATAPVHTSGYEIDGKLVWKFSGLRAKVKPTIVDGAVTGFRITNGGLGYSNAIVKITGSGGSGAMASVNVTNGAVYKIVMVNQGSGYSTTNPPIVEITAAPNGGVSATAVPVIAAGKITAIKLTNCGAGYDENLPPTVTVTSIGASPGVGATAAAYVGDGVISSLTSDEIGSNYSSAVVKLSGDGIGAVIEPIISNGVLTSLTVEEKGSGYNQAPAVDFNGPTGISSIVVPNPTGSGYTDPTVEIVRKGAVSSVEFKLDVNGERLVGSGYDTAPTVVVGNVFSGASSYAKFDQVVNTSGKIYTATAAITSGGSEPTHVDMSDTGNWKYNGLAATATATIFAPSIVAWAQGTPVVVGAIKKNTVAGADLVYRAVTAGTTGSTAPSWVPTDTDPLGQQSDGAVVWRYIGIVGQVSGIELTSTGDAVYLDRNLEVTFTGGTPATTAQATFTISGTGTGAKALARTGTGAGANKIIAVYMVEPGSGYQDGEFEVIISNIGTAPTTWATITQVVMQSAEAVTELGDKFYMKKLIGGDDGIPANNASVITGYENLLVEGVETNLVMTGAFNRIVQEYVITRAHQRKDFVAFVSPHNNGFPYLDSDPVKPVQSIISYRKGMAGLNETIASYGVMDTGFKMVYDKYQNTYVWVPLNGDVAGLCARTDMSNDPWWSPAGLNRGGIKNVVKLAYNPSQADRDVLYPSTVNPVVTFPALGTVLYGDRTCQMKASAFDRINVRRLFIVIEKAIATAAKYQLFEFNDGFTRAQFRNMVEPYLRQIVGRRGIIDFKVVCDESNNTPEVIDNNKFVADIYVKPNRSINFIYLNFIATRSDVDLKIVGGEPL
jgi:phage tail sheath protein FI